MTEPEPMDDRTHGRMPEDLQPSTAEAVLQMHYTRLREADAHSLPSVDAMFAAAGAETVAPAPRHRALAAAAQRWRTAARITLPLAAAATIALLFLARATPEARFRRTVTAYARDPALGAWRSPTAFLLAFPGHDLLSGVPRIGASITPDTASGTVDRPVTRYDTTKGD